MLEELIGRLGDGAVLISGGAATDSASDPEGLADARDVNEGLLWLARRIDLALGWRPTSDDLLEPMAALGGYCDHVARVRTGSRQTPAASSAAASCRRDVLVTAPELFQLADEARRRGVFVMSAVRADHGGFCNLLASGPRCLVEESRPFACRLHSHRESDLAPLRRAIMASIRAVCLARGWDARALSLSTALPAALEDPDLADAWLKGGGKFDLAARPLAAAMTLASERLAIRL